MNVSLDLYFLHSLPNCYFWSEPLQGFIKLCILHYLFDRAWHFLAGCSSLSAWRTLCPGDPQRRRLLRQKQFKGWDGFSFVVIDSQHAIAPEEFLVSVVFCSFTALSFCSLLVEFPNFVALFFSFLFFLFSVDGSFTLPKNDLDSDSPKE